MIYPKLLLIAVFTGTLSIAAWQRDVFSGKGEFLDKPAPHALAYFTRDPFLRDDGDDFCADCTPGGKAAVHVHHKFKTELKKVGVLQGFAIYDLFYYFDEQVESGEIGWKSILVSVSPGLFREIYHLQPTQAQIGPAFFLTAGTTELLGTRDLIPGTGNNYYEDYWWFGSEGPIRINIELIGEVLKSLLPVGYGVWKGGGLDMKSLTFQSPVWKNSDANCCPSGGIVHLKFRLDRGHLIVTEKYFDALAKSPE
ncbi:MAG: hypothetical protein WB992_26225 [Bryobacteraceae bacterium]